ncbi:hypothetical protein OROMI_033289 [Orobanche minor]
MKKLLIYWTLVSLISLFEFTFVKIIEWIPFWSSIKLIAVLWLAMPRFHGACYAYQSYIRPYLVVYLQEIIRRFEEQCSTTGIFLDDVADRYKKENEFGDSEKLIVIESDEKNDASASVQRNEPAAAALELKDNEMLEALEKKSAGSAAATQTKQPARPVTKETTYAAVVTKDRQEWTCSLYTRPGSPTGRKDGSKQKSCRKPEERAGNQDGGATHHFCFLCNVKLVGNASLSSHLKGKKHSSNVESKWGKLEGVVT